MAIELRFAGAVEHPANTEAVDYAAEISTPEHLL
jgi:hypothetical protein